jgi:agmatine deiminase
MRRKIIGFFVCMLMIITCSIPVLGECITLQNEDNHLQKNNHDLYSKINDHVRSIAEFEAVDELILTWPMKWNDIRYALWLEPYLIDIIQAAEDAVHIRININNPLMKIGITSKLKKAGVPGDNITFTWIPTNSIWIRDYGPFFVEKNNDLAIVDFNYGLLSRSSDNLYPTFYGIINNINYSFNTNFLLCFHGGNFMTDGQGRAMIADAPLNYTIRNRLLTNEEIIDILKSNLGLDEVYIFKSQADDGTGHIDMFSKLLDNHTVLVGRWEPNDVDYQILEDNAVNFSILGLHVLRIPMLRDSNSKYHTIWSYTNSLIINGTHKKVVLVPQYNVTEDSVAFSIYQQAMPEYEIRGIDCRRIIQNQGAIHCTTMTRPFID